MLSRSLAVATLAVATLGTNPAPAAAQVASAPAAAIKVTPKTYIRAETDRSFGNIAKQAGGVNQWFYIRKPTPLDMQTVIRMNKDTLYSASIVDTSRGATVTVPAMPAGRFMSVQLVDNDHYAPAVHYAPGTYQLPKQTKYIAVLVRTQVFNPKDAEELALVHKLQDSVIVKAGSADPFTPPNWDQESLKALTDQYNKESASYPSWKGMMGPRGKVNEKTRHLAAAAAWGLNPAEDATYLNYTGGDDKVCQKATYKVPENKAFWSITIYGSDGYMKSENSIVNSSTAKLNADGRSFIVFFGSKEVCGDVANRLDVTEGWNFVMRVYRPGPSVLNGTYKLAKAVPVK